MSFRLVTLDDLERRNSPNGSVISPNLVAFGVDIPSPDEFLLTISYSKYI